MTTSYHHLSGLQISQLFKRGELSAVEIATSFLERIQQLDPQLNSFVSCCPNRAMAQAKALDEKRRHGQTLGRLAAIPIAVKDNIHIKGEVTSCSSRFLSNYIAPFSASATQLLEAEGAIFLGKTNMDEFGMGSTTENSAFKKTHNPWDKTKVPGGSSGGSAAAVAAQLCPIALGSDTGGSIRQPSSFCGIIGFKPSYGRVSRYGLVAYGSSLDQIGPMTRCVKDAAAVMEVIGRPCLHDATSLPLPPDEILTSIDHPKASPWRIGVPYSLLKNLSEPVRVCFEEALRKLQIDGAELVEVDLELLHYAIPTYYIIATAEASTNLARFDGIRYGCRSEKAKSIDELYEYSKEEGFGTEVKRRILLGTFVLSAGHQEAYYRKAQQVRTLMIHRFKQLFDQVDLIATPVSPQGAFSFEKVKDPLEMYMLDVFTVPANLCGLPAVSLPAGFDEQGMPLGLQLVAAQKKDKTLLKAAADYERVAIDLNLFTPPFIKEGGRL